MPQRISRSAPPRPRPLARATPSPVTTTPAWTARRATRTNESSLDRWQRLHAPVHTPVPVRSRTVSDEATRLARETAGLTGKQAQEMLDTLNGYGLAEPMWPHFKSMGFRESDAGLLREALKRFDQSRSTSVTSLAGTAWLAPRVATLGKLTALVDALTAGKSGAAELAKLPEANARALRHSGEQLPKHASTLLERELGYFFTDSPADLVGTSPAVVQKGLAAAIRIETARLLKADDATLRQMRHEGFSSIGLLRELAVLDPREAQKLGAAFAGAFSSKTDPR